MKIRRGFVTNSSSSSFIIAKKGNVDKMRLGYELLNQKNLNNLVNDFMKDTNFSLLSSVITQFPTCKVAIPLNTSLSVI